MFAQFPVLPFCVTRAIRTSSTYSAILQSWAIGDIIQSMVGVGVGVGVGTEAPTEARGAIAARHSTLPTGPRSRLLELAPYVLRRGNTHGHDLHLEAIFTRRPGLLLWGSCVSIGNAVPRRMSTWTGCRWMYVSACPAPQWDCFLIALAAGIPRRRCGA